MIRVCLYVCLSQKPQNMPHWAEQHWPKARRQDLLQSLPTQQSHQTPDWPSCDDIGDKDGDDDYQMGDKKVWKMNMLNEWKKKGNDSDLSVLMR